MVCEHSNRGFAETLWSKEEERGEYKLKETGTVYKQYTRFEHRSKQEKRQTWSLEQEHMK